MLLRPFLAPALCLGLFSSATAQTVYTNDVSIKGGGTEDQLCVGDNCANDEVYASNKVKIRIKDENTALEFSDVNGTDWIIEANQGGTENLRFGSDSTGSKSLVIDKTAASNTLFMSSAPLTVHPRIGMGTSLPEAELHIVSAGGVGFIMEDSALGQKWIAEVTNGSFAFIDDIAQTSPFRIETGAPSGAIWVKRSGNIGMGTNQAETGLHLRRGDGNGAILVEETSAGTLGQMTLRNNGITFFTLEDTSIAADNNTGRAWNFQNQAGTFRVTTAPGGPGEIEMLMTPAGDMTIKGSLTTGGGTCGGGCDAVFSDGYDLPSITEYAEAMWSLGHLPNVGPTVENAPINVSDKLGRILNELEHAHIYIDQLHDRPESQDARHRQQIAALTARLDALDAQ